MTAIELKEKLDQNSNLQVIDVREYFELEICSLSFAHHIPMEAIPAELSKLPKNKDLVIVCHHGIRSAQVVSFLLKQGFKRVFNLEGGIHQWAIDVDLNMTRY